VETTSIADYGSPQLLADEKFGEARHEPSKDCMAPLRRRSSLKLLGRRLDNHPQISQISQMSRTRKKHLRKSELSVDKNNAPRLLPSSGNAMVNQAFEVLVRFTG
jgi:hypothetical protein